MIQQVPGKSKLTGLHCTGTIDEEILKLKEQPCNCFSVVNSCRTNGATSLPRNKLITNKIKKGLLANDVLSLSSANSNTISFLMTQTHNLSA